MSLVRLIYASTLKKGLAPSELKKINDVANSHNSKECISGMLVFGNDYFLQCLEGARESVNNLYCKIVSDKRHENPVLVEYSEISERNFDEWSMKLVLLTAKKMQLVRRYSPKELFDPYTLSGSSALKMMIALKVKEL